MKKIFSLFAAILFAGSMMADEVTFTPANCGWTETAGAQSGIVDGVSVATTNGLVGEDYNTKIAALRIYKNETLTISAEQNITKIVFSCAANGETKYGPGCFAAQEGYTFEADGPTGTWEGSATSVAFVASSNQVRATQIVVTLGEAPKVATPVISGDAEFTDSVIVTITCSTPEADIYYTIDGTTDPKCDCAAAPEYKNPIVIKETTTIKAAAYTGNDWSAVATKTFTKVAPLTDPTNCAEAAEAALSVSGNNVPYNNGKEYTIEGFVTSIATEWSEQYKNITFWIADTEDGGEVLQAFRAVCETEADAPAVGDKVAVTGKLTKYNTTPEFAAGCTFKVLGGIDPWKEIIFTAATAAGAFNDSVFAEDGFKLTCIDTDNSKIKTTANDAAFGDANEYAMYKFRLQTGGKSGSKNAMKLTIPGDGFLRIAVRSGNNDDTTRTVVLAQGTDTLYKDFVKEADAVEVPITDSTKLKVYPYIIVPVKKGEVSVGYPVNAVNFYSFAFLAGAAPEPVDTIPTTAPAAPKQAEKDVMGIYCNYYKENNLNFAISGWAGAYQTLDLQGTNVAYWKGMTWECIIDPVNTDAAHDFSDYENIHVDMWAPQAAKIKFTVEAVAGGNYKDGMVAELKQGWNCFDFELAKWTGAYDFKNVKCFVLEQYQTPAGESFEGNPFAVANIYFWNAPTVDTLTCAKAAEDALAGETYEAYVKGYVTEIAYAWKNGSMSFWMADAKDGGKVFEAYKCAIEKEEDAVGVGDLVLAHGTLTKYGETPEFAQGCTVEILEKAERPEVDTIACAAAREAALAGDSSIVVVKGYVTEIVSAWNSQYKNISFWMADTKDGGQVLQAYRASCASADEAPTVGALVVAKGKLSVHGETPELAAGCTFKILEKGDDPIVPEGILSIDFTAGQGEWTIEIKNNPDSLGFVWNQDSRYGMKASAYVDNTNHETEAWLISPAFSLSEETAATLLISHARKYGELDQLSVQAKAGDGEWAKLNVSAWPDGSNWDFLDAEADLSAFAGKANVQVAFVYTSSSSAAATWEIKTVKVEGGSEGIENVVLTEKAQKVIVDGVLYIIRDNKMYNVQGLQVR